MSPWWEKSSSKEEEKKGTREGIIGTIRRKLSKSRRSRSDTISEKGPRSPVPSGSSSSSTRVSDRLSFADRPLAQPLPLPRTHLRSANYANSGTSAKSTLESARGLKSSQNFPPRKPGCVSKRQEPTNAEEDIAITSVYSDSSLDSDDQCEPQFHSPLAFDREYGNQANTHNTFRSAVHRNQSPIAIQNNSKVSSKAAPQLSNHQHLSNKHKGTRLYVPSPQMDSSGGLRSAPESSKTSPSISPPIRRFGSEQVLNSGFYTGRPHTDIASGHSSSPGSCHNSVGRDLLGQSRYSPEYSPIPSPGMTSPGLSSRVYSGAVTPLHPRVGGAALESPARRTNDVKQRTYRLPLPPIKVPNNPPLSTTTTPSAPSSPAIAENLTSPRSGWKKGQLLGRGTFGHVYLGFNSENGEMCAMKEVTLFSDDAKSRESAQQLAQEIALLSSLRHPNIVQYYGSETVDDKIYIYLEYVSGGSIYKLLQQYGPLGEVAIRNYTRQILLGLAYLHAKNTVHRDIKAANILVDPNGRVKLADFGMAKHISGQPCALSLKGSPFWMAPEVIKNSSDCNTAVDIWSLGCTVLEMATTKPPWSEYEGVAAMFKIGYSKELPAMPDHLSEEGKDFIRLCLQRNPDSRPPATQFLMHPFVRNVAAERPILSDDPSEARPALVNAMRSLAIVPPKHKSGLASEAAGTHLSRSSRTVSGSSSSYVHTPRNISHPVSPTVRSLHGSERLSPSPISSPHTASGSSTPPNGGTGAVHYHHTRQLTFSLEDTNAFQVPQTSQYSNANTPISSPRTASPTGGIGAVPFHATKKPTFSYEGVRAIPRPRNPHYSNANTAYQDPNRDQRWRVTQGTFALPDIVSSNSDARGNQNRRVGQGFSREFHHGKSHLHDRV